MPQGFAASVLPYQLNVGVLHTIEHSGLDRGVMVHILKGQLVADFQRMQETKLPGTNVPVQTSVAPQTIDVLSGGFTFRDSRRIWHLKAIGHVA